MKKINLLVVVIAGAFAVACNGGSAGSSNPEPTPTITPTPVVGIINLPQTGQTPTSPVNPALTGMDGYTFIGVPWAYVISGATTPVARFTIGAGAEVNCITDNLTGLMWVKDLNTVIINGAVAGAMTNWQNALNSIATANSGSGYCGHKDWYLPTVNDLTSLVNYGYVGSQSTWLNAQGFSNVQGFSYWSSTSRTRSSSAAWGVRFFDGYVDSLEKTGTLNIWPVRSGQ